VVSPLAAAGLGKEEIRAWSHRLGLPTWDKPQMACLASRIPYGTSVTPERLSQPARAGSELRRVGVRPLPVRYRGAGAGGEGAAGGRGGGAGPLLLAGVPRSGERGAAGARLPLRLVGPGALPVGPDEPGPRAPRGLVVLPAVGLALLLGAAPLERFDHQGSIW